MQLTEHTAFCSLNHTKIILNGWGDCSLCCYQLTQLGSILGGKTVLDLWNSPLAKDIRRETALGNLHKVCTSWNTCPFQVKERIPEPFLAYENCEYPTYLEICLPNTHCNIGLENPTPDTACIMCCRSAVDFNPQPQITDLLCEKSLPLMPYLKTLCVLGVAEPFWKDAVFEVFKKIDFHKYKHQIQFTTNTNVVCLTEKVTERFFQEVECSDISFSLDAASSDTYLKIRKIDSYHVCIKNLKNYMILRDQNGGWGRHKTFIYNNINMLNVSEMPKMVEVAAELHVDKIIMLPTHDQCGRVAMGDLILNDKNIDVFKRYSEAARKRADQLSVNLYYSKPFDTLPPPVGQESPGGTPKLVQIKL